MDADTTNNLITAGAGLVGALIGGGASILGTGIQQRHERAAEIERERRADKRQRRDAAEERARLAATRCDEEIAALTEQIREWDRSGSELGQTHEYSALIQARERTVDLEAHYLPGPLRRRVDEAVLLLHHGDRLSEYLYNYDPLSWTAYTVGREVHRLIACWQRGEDLPLRSPEWCDLVFAAEEVEAFHEELWNDLRGQEIQEAQEGWRENHEEGLARIRGRD